MSKAALIVVDVQRDFCQGGALAAADTLSLLQALCQCIDQARSKGALIVFTRDWHPVNHSSFQVNGGIWPVHCVAGTRGAEIMPKLGVQPGDLVVDKGVSPEGQGYSGFEETGLAQRLKSLQVERLGVSGIATEYCVKATALDALRAGFPTAVLTDVIRAVKPEDTPKILQELATSSVKTQSSDEWLRTL